MDLEMKVFIGLLALVWFVFYWIFGGVFFSLVALLRLGRIHTLRFSCLYTFGALFSGIGAALTGVLWAKKSMGSCADPSSATVEAFAAMFACGFVGIMAGMLVWAAAVMALGFLFMSFARMKDQPWFMKFEDEGVVLDDLEEEPHDEDVSSL